MVNYSNLFSCSINSNKDEIVLFFKQQSPQIDETGKTIGISIEDVSGIVLNRSGALALQRLINDILKDSD